MRQVELRLYSRGECWEFETADELLEFVKAHSDCAYTITPRSMLSEECQKVIRNWPKVGLR